MALRILAVDDDVELLTLLGLTLKRHSYEVIKAQSGPQALNFLAHDMPDLMLLDVMMPQMDGYEVCRQVKANPCSAHLPVVMLSAKAELESQAAGFRAGADDYVTKPISPSDLAARIQVALARVTSRPIAKNAWVVSSRPNPRASLRLFCFPYSGASASIFCAWPDNLLPSVEVCPVELPGRGTRLAEPPYARLEPFVQAVAQALLPFLDKPFALFGHSLGALACFELARHLRRYHSLNPACLFVSGHSAPQIPDTEPPIHDLPEADFMEKVRSLNGTPEEVLQHEELRQLILPILRADFAMCGTFTYEADCPLDCPISAYGGLQDSYVTRNDLDAWREQTNASFSLRMFPGDHFFINTARPLVLRTLARELDQLVREISARRVDNVSSAFVAPPAPVYGVGRR